jgi:hypothetical protein
MALKAEEAAAQLLDQIEPLARSRRRLTPSAWNLNYDRAMQAHLSLKSKAVYPTSLHRGPFGHKWKGSQYGSSSSIFGSFRRICHCRNRRDHHDDQIGRDQANPRYFVGTDFKNLASSVGPPPKRKYCPISRSADSALPNLVAEPPREVVQKTCRFQAS